MGEKLQKVREPRPQAYQFQERARNAYAHWLAGYSEEEIGEFMSITPREVSMDIQHIHAHLPTRTVLMHTNQRTQILLQRTQSEKYRKLLGDSLSTPVDRFLDAGVSPTAPLKEFREAVGMVPEKGGGVNVHVTQSAYSFGGSEGRVGISSSEELFRRVMAELDEPAVIDATPVEAAEAPSEAEEIPEVE